MVDKSTELFAGVNNVGISSNGASSIVIVIGVVAPPAGFTVFAPPGHTPVALVLNVRMLPVFLDLCSILLIPFELLFGIKTPHLPVCASTFVL